MVSQLLVCEPPEVCEQIQLVEVLEEEVCDGVEELHDEEQHGEEQHDVGQHVEHDEERHA